jgi:hypothetical protein
MNSLIPNLVHLIDTQYEALSRKRKLFQAQAAIEVNPGRSSFVMGVPKCIKLVFISLPHPD